MTIDVKQKIYELVKRVCNQCTSNIPSKDALNSAYEILKVLGVTQNARIVEIPLCSDNEICIRFTIGEDFNNCHVIFDLVTGVSLSDPELFFLEISIEDYIGNSSKKEEYDIFPCAPDAEDVGFYLINIQWHIKEGKAVD